MYDLFSSKRSGKQKNQRKRLKKHTSFGNERTAQIPEKQVDGDINIILTLSFMTALHRSPKFNLYKKIYPYNFNNVK